MGSEHGPLWCVMGGDQTRGHSSAVHLAVEPWADQMGMRSSDIPKGDHFYYWRSELRVSHTPRLGPRVRLDFPEFWNLCDHKTGTLIHKSISIQPRSEPANIHSFRMYLDFNLFTWACVRWTIVYLQEEGISTLKRQSRALSVLSGLEFIHPDTRRMARVILRCICPQ